MRVPQGPIAALIAGYSKDYFSKWHRTFIGESAISMPLCIISGRNCSY